MSLNGSTSSELIDDRDDGASSPPTVRVTVLKRLKNGFQGLCSAISVEPTLFFHMVAWSSLGVNLQGFYIEKICDQEYRNDSSVDCTNLTANKAAELHVQSIATIYSTGRNLIEALLPVVFSLFVGPWSDKHGSKGIMILSLVGYTCSSGLLYLLSLVDDLDPKVILIASVPVALTGGVIGLLVSAFRYVAAASTLKNRSFRMAVAEGMWFLGSPIGLLGSAELFKIYGFPVVFMASSILFVVAGLYTVCFVKNDKPPSDRANLSTVSSICADMFNIEAVKDTFRTTFGKRSGSLRLWIILLLVVMYLRVFTIYGNITVTYLYTREMFSWDSPTYSAYVVYDGVIGIVGSSVVALLGMKIFKISDSKIGLLSAVSYVGGAVVWIASGFTDYSWMMYLGATVQMFCGLITIMSRSMVSKIVHKDEVGKVYSLLASGEAAVPIFAAPIYNFIYWTTVESFPAASYVLTASINVIILAIFAYFCITSWNTTTIAHEALEEGVIHRNEIEPRDESSPDHDDIIT